MDCSVVVISRNRPRYLERLFGYYADEGLDAPILLGDASEPEAAEAVAVACRNAGSRLDIRCTVYEAGSSPVGRLRAEFDKLETGTAIWVGDDDFVSPRLLREAVDQLAREPEYAAVTGRAMTFAVAGDGPGGKISGMGDYLQKGYVQVLASERLLAQAKDGVALTYSVRRTSVVQSVLGDIDDLTLSDDALGYYLFELLDGMLTVLAGKVALCDGVMMARQVHAASTAAAGRQGPDRLGMLTRADWPQAFAKAQELVTNRLSEAQPELDAAKAREIAETAFLLRLRAMIDKTLARRLSGPQRSTLGRRAAAGLARLRGRRGGELGRMMAAVAHFQTND